MPPASGERSWDEEVARLLGRPEALRCVYQPVVDLHTGDCAGFEALTRIVDWPAHSPQPWFTAAIRAGLAGRLEAASLQQAVKVRHELGPEQFLAVNVTAAHLDEVVVLDALREQPDPAALVVELGYPDGATETVPETALSALRTSGVRVACDVTDGRRGELDRMARLRPDLVKLDVALVKGAPENLVSNRLVRLVVGMADDMGAVVQAEGVESLDDARYLQGVGVRLAQGWLFGRARPSLQPPPGEVSSWLRTSWQETVAATRTGRLAQPLVDLTAELDDDGRLLALVDPDGTRIPASRMLRLRAAQDLRSAAVRVLASGPDRRPWGVLAVTDDDGRFLGVTDVDALMREVIAESR